MDENEAERAKRMVSQGEAMGLSCLHSPNGLCESCRQDRDADPTAWIEFGSHPQGEINWRTLQAEITADAARASVPVDPSVWDDIPF